MPEYQSQLRPQDSSESVFEPVIALDDDEARGLAEIRLLLTRGGAAVTVSRSGLEILHLRRDASRGPAMLHDCEATAPNGSASAEASR